MSETVKDILDELDLTPEEKRDFMLEALADAADEREHEADLRAAIADAENEQDVKPALQLVKPGPLSSLSLLDGSAIGAPLPPLEFLLRELQIVAGGGAPNIWAGYGYSGKTLAAQALALALAAGLPPWGGFRSQPPRRVLHVDLEQGERLTRRRYQRLARAMGITLADLGTMLELVANQSLALTPANAEKWRALMTGRDLIIIDSFRAATGGLDENSSEARAPLDALGALSEETHCTVIVIHHARKPSENSSNDVRYSMRGSSAIFDACDSINVFSAAKGEPVSVELTKARSTGEDSGPHALVIEDVEVDGDPKGGVLVTVRGGELVQEVREHRERARAQVVTRKDADAILSALRAHPGLGRNELVEMTRINSKRVGQALAELGAAVRFELVKEGRVTTKRHYLNTYTNGVSEAS